MRVVVPLPGALGDTVIVRQYGPHAGHAAEVLAWRIYRGKFLVGGASDSASRADRGSRWTREGGDIHITAGIVSVLVWTNRGAEVWLPSTAVEPTATATPSSDEFLLPYSAGDLVRVSATGQKGLVVTWVAERHLGFEPSLRYTVRLPGPPPVDQDFGEGALEFLG